jgi:hypothetical protein
MPAALPVVTPVAAVTSPQAVALEEQAKQQWAESFASKSGMNVTWSRK